MTVVHGFEAEQDGAAVVLKWQTAIETDTIAFALYRHERGSDTVLRAPSRLLPALGTEPAGATYGYTDHGVVAGRSYEYEIERIAPDGRRERVGRAAVDVVRVSNREPAPSATPRPAFGNIPGYTACPHAPALRWTALTGAAPAGAGKSQTGSGQSSRLKIRVRERGLHYLSATDIADGLTWSPHDVTNRIASRTLRISSAGSRRAYIPEDDGSGLCFYHEGFDSNYTDANVFWLERGTGWVVPPATGATPTAPAPASQSFRETLHFEDDVFYATQYGEWLWIHMFVNSNGVGVTNEIALPGVAADGADASVSVRFVDTSLGEHRLKLNLNGQQIGTWDWSSSTWQNPTFAFDHALLTNGVNHLGLVGQCLGGTEVEVMMVDACTFTYSRRYEAVDGRLPASDAGHEVVTVRGFTNSDVLVVDVTDARWPRWVADTLIDGTNGSYAVSFYPPTSNGNYVVSERTALFQPVSLVPRGLPGLRSGTNAADYVIITRADMLAAADRLAAHRQSSGWQSMTVDIENVYDAFNWGVEAPAAITRFLAHAQSNWRVPPTHVALAGAAAFDYKNLMNVPNTKNVVPTIMVKTPFGYFSSDNRLADFENDDSVPDVAIGRLPAMTPQELSDMVDKIIAYELQAGDAWGTNTLWVADNADPGGAFDADSDTVAALLPPPYAVEKLYLYTASTPDPTPPFYRRSMLVSLMESAWNAGQALINYRGHGNWNVWAEESIFDPAGARALANGAALPLVVVPSCQVNWHEHSLLRCLGEELLLNTQGGAVAVWAPSGPSVNAYATEIDKHFMQVRYAGAQVTIGSAVREALAAYSAETGVRFAIDNFILLADPATRLK